MSAGSSTSAPVALSRLPALDGLRGMAALLVVLTHASFLTGSTTSTGLVGHLMGRGDFGVSLFFALSGFLLYRILVAEAQDSGRPHIGSYAARRFARVLPAYWLTVLVIVALTGAGARDSLLHLTGTQIYVADSMLPAFGQSWSIATELSFYLLLPFLVVGLQSLRRRSPLLPMRALLVALVVTSALGFVVGSATLGQDIILERWLPWRAPHFLVGMIFAEALIAPQVRAARWLRTRARDVGGCLAVAGAAYLASTTPLAGSLLLEPAHGLQLVLRTGFATLFAAGLLLPLALGQTSAWSTFLSRPFVRWLGVISYGIFLWHLPVFEALFYVSDASFFRGGLVPLLIVGVPISMLLGFLSHQFLELPISRLVARAGARRRNTEASEQEDPHQSLQPRQAKSRGGEHGLKDR
ncbi:MAG: acyltransferase [Actinomycetia bacterium]|nr:acyltransferase [Actinomycetes bacterium]